MDFESEARRLAESPHCVYDSRTLRNIVAGLLQILVIERKQHAALKVAFRVNILRLKPDISHAEIDAVIENATQTRRAVKKVPEIMNDRNEWCVTFKRQ